MRLLLCGDRNWKDGHLIRSVLGAEIRAFMQANPGAKRSDVVVIEGEARGADQGAAAIAVQFGCTVERYPADWDKYGRAAGPIRNRQMLRIGKPDKVIAFHDDIENSKGTKNMVEIAREDAVIVEVISHEEEKNV